MKPAVEPALTFVTLVIVRNLCYQPAMLSMNHTRQTAQYGHEPEA
jgi:hypothetical protein